MRFIHTADWHLGRHLRDYSLEDHQAEFLDHFVDLVKDQSPQAVLLAGDVYDRAFPPVSAVRLLNEVLRRLVELTHVVVISGNHDSAERLGFAADFVHPHLHLACQNRRVGTPITFGSGTDSVHIYPVPYLEPDIARHQLSEAFDQDGARRPLARSHEAVVGAAMRRIERDLSTRPGVAVAMLHAFVFGARTSDSELDISVGGAQSVSIPTLTTLGNPHCPELSEAAQRMRYIACGHLHRPQNCFSDDAITIRYSGSPLPMSFSEADDRKSTSIVEVSARASVVEQIPTPSGFQVRSLSGSFSDLINNPPPWAGEVFTSLEVTDTVRPEEMFNRLRAIYPRSLLIRHVGSSATALPAASRQLLRAQPRELTSQFFTHMLNRELTEVELRIVEDVWSQLRRKEFK